MSILKYLIRNWWSVFDCNMCTIIVFTIYLRRKQALAYNGFVYYVAMVVNKWTIRWKWTTFSQVYHIDGFLARKSVDRKFIDKVLYIVALKLSFYLLRFLHKLCSKSFLNAYWSYFFIIVELSNTLLQFDCFKKINLKIWTYLH